MKSPSQAPQVTGASARVEAAIRILAQGQVARSRLIGTGEPDDQAANIRFVKSGGRFREVGGATTGDLASVLEYYQSLSPRRMVVLGEPGAGKTVLAMELLIRLLETRQRETGDPVPVLISAAAYDTRLAWEEWLPKHLALRFSIGKEAAVRLVRDGRILPIVDGVDEMDPAGKPERSGVLVAALNASMRGRERAPIVVTCRSGEYQGQVRKIDRATHIQMLPLSSDEAADYLQDQFIDHSEQQRWEPALASLHASPDGALAAQLATPWRLTVALTAFRNEGDPSSLLPPRPNLAGAAAQEYAQGVDSLLLSLYVSSAIRLHALEKHYTEQQVQRWLRALAAGLAWQARHNKSATDIQLNQWWQPIGQRSVRLAHIAVTALPCIAFLMITAAVTHNVYIVATSGAILLLAVMAGFALSPNQLKARQMATRHGFIVLAVGIVGGIVLGFAVESVLGSPSNLAFTFSFGLAGGLAGALAFVLNDNSPQSITPSDVIRADGRYGFAIGLAFLFAAVFAGAFTGAIGFGLEYGIGFGLAYGIGIGANTWTRYYLTVLIIAVRHQGPLRFGAFLNWAQQAGLLRISGVAYQFRHRQLQDWLTPS